MKILSADFIIGAASPSQFPTDGLPQIAFAGRSNVGKSTLLNALMGRKKLVKTSARPGKTKEINFFLVNNAFYMVDLPGVGYAKLPTSDRERISRLLQRFGLRPDAGEGQLDGTALAAGLVRGGRGYHTSGRFAAAI